MVKHERHNCLTQFNALTSTKGHNCQLNNYALFVDDDDDDNDDDDDDVSLFKLFCNRENIS